MGHPKHRPSESKGAKAAAAARYYEKHGPRVRGKMAAKYRDDPQTFKSRTQRYRSQHPDYRRDHALRKNYGISSEEYDRILLGQGGLCAICRCPESQGRQDPRTGRPQRFAVDHDHSTKQVRGLLCAHCNMGIGQLGEDPLILRAAVSYIEKWTR